MRRIFWTVIVEGKHGLQGETSFDFKYVPDLHKFTALEGSSYTGPKEFGMERRNLHSFLIACSLVALMTSLSLHFIARLYSLPFPSIW